MSEKIVHMMVGIPGSGKSTRVKELVKEYNAVYLSADAIREELTGDAGSNSPDVNAKTFGILFGRYRKALTDGRAIVIDNTNYNRSNRKQFLSMAQRAGYKVWAHEMQTPHEVSRERNKKRERVVPDEVMDRMIKGYHKPDPSSEYIEKVIPVTS